MPFTPVVWMTKSPPRTGRPRCVLAYRTCAEPSASLITRSTEKASSGLAWTSARWALSAVSAWATAVSALGAATGSAAAAATPSPASSTPVPTAAKNFCMSGPSSLW